MSSLRCRWYFLSVHHLMEQQECCWRCHPSQWPRHYCHFHPHLRYRWPRRPSKPLGSGTYTFHRNPSGMPRCIREQDSGEFHRMRLSRSDFRVHFASDKGGSSKHHRTPRSLLSLRRQLILFASATLSNAIGTCHRYCFASTCHIHRRNIS